MPSCICQPRETSRPTQQHANRDQFARHLRGRLRRTNALHGFQTHWPYCITLFGGCFSLVCPAILKYDLTKGAPECFHQPPRRIPRATSQLYRRATPVPTDALSSNIIGFICYSATINLDTYCLSKCINMTASGIAYIDYTNQLSRNTP